LQPRTEGNVTSDITVYCSCSSRLTPSLKHRSTLQLPSNPEMEESGKPEDVALNPFMKQGQIYRAKNDNKEKKEEQQSPTPERQMKRLSEWIERWRRITAQNNRPSHVGGSLT
uniref:Chromosome 2 open reading frame 73 n=1 Tax=Elaeophora elaphi TaxID=1147741 RepID=A0A0R3RVG5_9BILA